MNSQWERLCENPQFRDLPYKVELNRLGQIIMSPATNRHGSFQSRIAHLLQTFMPDGDTFTELGVETEDSVKVADVAWASGERCSIIEDQASASIAPEICVEVKSPSNTPSDIQAKGELYLRAGAVEFWNCDREGNMTFFDMHGLMVESQLCPGFPSKLPRRSK